MLHTKMSYAARLLAAEAKNYALILKITNQRMYKRLKTLDTSKVKNHTDGDLF